MGSDGDAEGDRRPESDGGRVRDIRWDIGGESSGGGCGGEGGGSDSSGADEAAAAVADGLEGEEEEEEDEEEGDKEVEEVNTQEECAGAHGLRVIMVPEEVESLRAALAVVARGGFPHGVRISVCVRACACVHVCVCVCLCVCEYVCV